ncbi:MAG TPA: SDR family oxidoreductase [Caulobacteraceae bacterium]|nr:SDR family oxidoreductase [Caulobacteraceae bacterium]
MPARGAALVTGGARRIGRALAIAAAQAGYDVAVHHRDSAEDAEGTAEACRVHGVKTHVIASNLADEPSRLIAQTADALGPVTLLVNNASVFLDDQLGAITRETWDAHMEANLHAPIALAQAFAAQGGEGLIVNLIDQRVWRPNPQFFSYSLSKAGLWWATRTMAQALAPRIRVNGIGPGPTLPSIHQRPEDFEAEARNVPLQRRATPGEIAAALRYLIDAPSVTGQMIAVDGGQHLAWQTPDIQ